MTFGVHYYDKNGREVTGTQFYKTACEERDAQIAELQEQVQKLAADKEKYLVECMATKIAIQYLKAGESDFTLNTPATDAVIREIGAKAVEGFEKYCLHLAECSGDKRWVGCSRNAALYANTIRAGEQP